MNRLILLTFVILVANTNYAFAYLDPGTGSIILQGLIAALAAGAVFVKIYWYKLLTLLGIKKKGDFDDKKNTDNKK